jgi:peptidoglycan/LPS O-acetylase OafA/YrhL
MSTPGSKGLGYLPGLDGIRAFALIPVMLFHSGFAWVPGAMFGLSTFFTMSGYLITSLLIEEHKGTGGIGLGEFWRRRFRRLLPGSLLAMLLAIAFGIFAADATQRAELGGDIAASLAYVANWWFIATGQTYAALFEAPSPLLHIWSLAVEEQFYLVLPLVAFAFLRRRSTNKPLGGLLWKFGIAIGIAFVATTALPFIFTISDNFFYYATPTRLPEMLSGVLLAIVLAPGTRRQVLSSARAVPWATVGGVVAVLVMLWLWGTTGLATPWVYKGGFAAFSLVSIVLILSVHNNRSPVTKALTIPPMLHLGRISYGVYLFHWPIFLWITPANTGLDGWPLFFVRMAVTIGLAELSFRFIESPIRRTGRLEIAGALRPLGRVAPVAVAVLVIGGFLTSATAPPPALNLARSEAQLSDFNQEFATLPPSAVTDLSVDATEVSAIEALLPTEPPPLRVAVYGDSSALTTTYGIGRWATEDPTAEFALGSSMVGCGVNRSGERYYTASRILPIADWCREWPAYWTERTRASLPNTALVQVGPWELLPRRFTPDGPLVGPGDPEWEEVTLNELLEAVDLLNAQGTFAVFATAPPPNSNLGSAPNVGRENLGDLSNLAPDRFAIFNQLLQRLPELRPGRVATVDLAGWTATQGERDLLLRPDGVHAGDEGTNLVAAEFLGPQLKQIWDAAWRTGKARTITAEAIARRTAVAEPRRWEPGQPYRVLVWSDARAPEVAAAVEAATTGVLPPGTKIDVEVVAPAGCGVARSRLQRTPDGDIEVPRACNDRAAITETLDRTDPNLVLVAPGVWEHGEFSPYPNDVYWVTPDDAYGGLWFIGEMGSAVDLAARGGALVGLVNLPATPPTVVPSEAADRETSAINTTLGYVAGAPDRSPWLRLIDLRNGADPVAAIRQLVLESVTPPTTP